MSYRIINRGCSSIITLGCHSAEDYSALIQNLLQFPIGPGYSNIQLKVRSRNAPEEGEGVGGGSHGTLTPCKTS